MYHVTNAAPGGGVPYGLDGKKTNRWRIAAYIYKSRRDTVQWCQLHGCKYAVLSDVVQDRVGVW